MTCPWCDRKVRWWQRKRRWSLLGQPEEWHVYCLVYWLNGR